MELPDLIFQERSFSSENGGEFQETQQTIEVQKEPEKKPVVAEEFSLEEMILSPEQMKKIDPSYEIQKKVPRNPDSAMIRKILDKLPKINCVSSEAQDLCHEQFYKAYARQMSQKTFMLLDSEEAIESYVNKQASFTKSSWVQDSDEIGIKQAFAESCSTTQATFKTKKNTNSKMSLDLKGGIVSIKNLLHAKDIPVESGMSIHFRKKLTRRQVIDLNATLSGITVKDLLLSDGRRISKVSTSYEETEDDEMSYNSCYDVYGTSHLPVRTSDDSPYCLRIYFDINRLYEYRLTPAKISKILLSDENINSSVRMIPSSFSDAFIDVYTTSDIKDPYEQESDLFFLSFEKICSVIIQGIPEIKIVAPESVAYSTLFREIRKVNEWDDAPQHLGKLLLEYDLMTLANHGYPSYEFIEDSLKKAGVVILDRLYKKHSDRLYAYVIEEVRSHLKKDGLASKLENWNKNWRAVFSYIENHEESVYLGFTRAEEDKKVVQEIFEELIKMDLTVEIIEEEGKIWGYQVSQIVEGFSQAMDQLEVVDREYTYAITQGSTIDNICLHPWIDTSRLITNSVPQMSRYFGIEVARNYFIYHYTANKVAMDSLTHPSYTFILADDMTYWGVPLGITFYENVKKRDNDFIATSTISHPNQVFSSSATRGAVARATTNAASIMISGDIWTGTNFPGVFKTDPEKVLQILKKRRPKTITREADITELLRKKEDSVIESICEGFEDPVILRQNVTIPLIPDIQYKKVKIPKQPEIEVVSFISSDLQNNDKVVLVTPISEQKQVIADSIISLRECIRLVSLSRTFEFGLKISDFLVAPKREQNQNLFPDYLSEDHEDDEDEEFEEELNVIEKPISSENRYKIRMKFEVPMLI